MGIFKEFKEFAIKGNVVDTAVGIIIGAAFGKITASLVADVITPPIGLLIGGVDFSQLAIKLNSPLSGSPVVIAYGKFIQAVFDFTIVAFSVFLLIKAVNFLRRKEALKLKDTPAPTEQEKLLREIRDLLKEKA